MKEKLYIAYGSNLDRGQMARRCPTAEVVCSGMLYGHELLFRGSQFGAVATVEPKPGACVPVLVWKIKPSDERALDLYEGYPHLYRKENLSVTMDGRERDIMAYVMTGEREYGVPARSYYETIARGYADAGFDTGVLNEAVQESVRRMLNEVAPEEELNAKVTSIYEGHYGVQIGLTGYPAERLRDFSFMLAGHCPVKGYDR